MAERGGLTGQISVARADPSVPASISLVRAMEDEIDELYRDRSGSVRSVTAEPEEMRPPDGDFLVVVHEGRPVGCGGLKRLDGEACEIKRMYVAPEARGMGLSRMLLEALEERARELGFTIARLDMADRQPAARRLYEGAGYRRIAPYNTNDLATHWYERPLSPSPDEPERADAKDAGGEAANQAVSRRGRRQRSSQAVRP